MSLQGSKVFDTLLHATHLREKVPGIRWLNKKWLLDGNLDICKALGFSQCAEELPEDKSFADVSVLASPPF